VSRCAGDARHYPIVLASGLRCSASGNGIYDEKYSINNLKTLKHLKETTALKCNLKTKHPKITLRLFAQGIQSATWGFAIINALI
jgi:hypothetical protein